MLTTGWLHGANHIQAILNNRCVVFIISLRGQVCVHNISLTPPRFIEVPVPNQESARSYLCIRDIYFASFHDLFGIWNYFYGVVFLFWFHKWLMWYMYGLLFGWFLLYLYYLYSFTDTDDQHHVHITWRPNQIMFVSFNRNTACVTRGAGTGTAYDRGFSRYIVPESQEGSCVSP